MKINNSNSIHQSNIFPYLKSGNVSFGIEQTNAFTYKDGTQYTKVDLYDKTYYFKTAKDSPNLAEMVKNIKNTLFGTFVKFHSHEHFLPFILDRTPDIVKHQHIVENGNTKTEMNSETQQASKVFQELLGKNFDEKRITTIKYLGKPIPFFSNNVLELAFGYFDKSQDDLYLYIPKNKKIEILGFEGFVKKFRLNRLIY